MTTVPSATMSLAELEAELRDARTRLIEVERMEAERQKRWRPIALAGRTCAILFALTGAGCVIADLALNMAVTAPSAHQFVQIFGYQMIISSLILSLMTQGFSEPKRAS